MKEVHDSIREVKEGNKYEPVVLTLHPQIVQFCLHEAERRGKKNLASFLSTKEALESIGKAYGIKQV